MLLDFTPVTNKEISFYDFAQQFSLDDLRNATNASLDLILEIMGEADDFEMTFIPYDPVANDPHAPEELQHIGWSLAHLVAHVTATSEEWITYSSVLARGIPYGYEPRLRYETAWESLTTREQVLQRVEESRQIRLGYLSTWPATPHLDVTREVPDFYRDYFGIINAKSAPLVGLNHEQSHYEQFREVARQAREAARATRVNV